MKTSIPIPMASFVPFAAPPRPSVRKYLCAECGAWHREGINVEFDYHQAAAVAPVLESPATAGDLFALEMEAGEPKPAR